MTTYNLKTDLKQIISDLMMAEASGKSFKVEIKEVESIQSQRALYWIWINKIVKHLMANTDWNPTSKKEASQQLHQKLKHMYLGYEPQLNKDVPPQLKSLADKTKRDKGEMHHYMVQVDIHAMDKWGILLEKPEDSEFWKYHLEQTN